MTTATAQRKPTEIITEQPASKSLLFSVTAQTIQPMADRYLQLRVNGINDKEGLAVVHKARMDCVKARTTCEREHKAAKEDALRECQRIDKSRRELLAMIEPIEKHLTDQEESVARELARIEQAKADELYAARLRRLNDAGATMPEVTVRHLSEVDFEAELSRVAEAARLKREEEARQAAEAERLRIESEKLAAERAEFERQRQEQAAEATRVKKIEDDRIAAEQAELNRQREALAAEQRRIADEEAVRQRQAEMDRLQREAAEKARIETEQRLRREAEQAEQQKRLAEEARQREEALRPDREKLLAVADAVEAIKVPAATTPEMGTLFQSVADIIAEAALEIRATANAT